MRALPTKPKIKGNKFRKKSKLKEAKMIREKEGVLSHPLTKSKAYKLVQV